MAKDEKAPEEDPSVTFAKTVTNTLLENAQDIANLKHKFNALKKLLEAERVSPEILAWREQTRQDTIARAKDVWGLDYAEYSDGFYPSGNQIGRRYIIPQDFGLKSWNFEKPDENSKDPSPETQEKEAKKLGLHRILEWFRVREEAFLIFHGFKYKPLDDGPRLQSLCQQWSGVMLPPLAVSFTNARMIGGYYTVNLEVPAVLSPKSTLDLKAFFDDIGPHKYELGIFGEVIGKRAGYLYMEPHNLLSGR